MKTGSKDDEDEIYGMSSDVLQSISKNFSELEQLTEFDKVSAAANIENVPSKIDDFKLSLDVGPGSKDVKQVQKNNSLLHFKSLNESRREKRVIVCNFWSFFDQLLIYEEKWHQLIWPPAPPPSLMFP